MPRFWIFACGFHWCCLPFFGPPSRLGSEPELISASGDLPCRPLAPAGRSGFLEIETTNSASSQNMIRIVRVAFGRGAALKGFAFIWL